METATDPYDGRLPLTAVNHAGVFEQAAAGYELEKVEGKVELVIVDMRALAAEQVLGTILWVIAPAEAVAEVEAGLSWEIDVFVVVCLKVALVAVEAEMRKQLVSVLLPC